MPDVHQRPRRRKGGDPSPLGHLDAFVDAAEALLGAWDPALEGDGYPRNLPSFDAFVADLRKWRSSAEERAAADGRDVRPVDFADPKALRDWLGRLSSNIEDALAAGDDATRPPGRRALGRSMARAKILEAERALRYLIEAAERGAPAPRAE